MSYDEISSHTGTFSPVSNGNHVGGGGGEGKKGGRIQYRKEEQHSTLYEGTLHAYLGKEEKEREKN